MHVNATDMRQNLPQLVLQLSSICFVTSGIVRQIKIYIMGMNHVSCDCDIALYVALLNYEGFQLQHSEGC